MKYQGVNRVRVNKVLEEAYVCHLSSPILPIGRNLNEFEEYKSSL